MGIDDYHRGGFGDGDIFGTIRLSGIIGYGKQKSEEGCYYRGRLGDEVFASHEEYSQRDAPNRRFADYPLYRRGVRGGWD